MSPLSHTALTALLAISTAFTPLAQAQIVSSKRGLCYVEPKDGNDNNFWSSGDLTWYYNYLSTPTAALQKTNLQFVPMLWGAQIGNTDMSFYNSVKQQIQGGAKIPYVLGFNEPDGCANGGSCVDAQTAAETWIRQMEPLKKEFNISLGAPAVTSAPTGFNWLRNFFDQCAGRCNPDFVGRNLSGSEMVEKKSLERHYDGKKTWS
jgi:hypothetical protein